MRSAAELAAAQLAAYNAKDLDAFCACYSDDVVVLKLPSTTPALVGKNQFRANYVATFANPVIQAHVPTRLPLGETQCLDHEICIRSADPSEPPMELMVMYEARNDRIVKATFFFRHDA
ncbi:hypothetical protein SPRG_11270 [Saprolegnia parasitica CBS 223.65]|uniref:SnoaL-like domain-containing protein n=1 Tax=Saprolegnia parasitica (strain CBS 223.65) TaxID=695850 RepID=A0A067BZZ1_SAPPC|nr:hypothetical protein SPRG_11270 [Saprolegnia parasitica CBS 223.65]KDO23838.1 hypothetical protein SPRG_11270 [Saprolegnia parasitica CBS 223.65]|eukprot:XP_012205471.1 hypothetical protein SPRG_11270 [Saprolegnia parasitica CBS 223.65]